MESPFSPGTLSKLEYDSSFNIRNDSLLNLCSRIATGSKKPQSRLRIPFILLGSLVLALAISTAVLAVILSKKSDKKPETIIGIILLIKFTIKKSFVYILVDDGLCVTPYCVRAGIFLDKIE
jgi:hypothetical protein